MYRKTPDNQLAFNDFYLPFGGKLRKDNRWVRLAAMIPWETAEAFYEERFSQDNPQGPTPKSARVALGALIIKERLGVSDEEAVLQIQENPYLQYFLGFHEYRDEAPFDPSMFVHFRRRFTLGQLNRINEEIVFAEQAKDNAKEPSSDDHGPDDPPSSGEGGNSGKLIVDATCTPADIRYPTDISLVNEAREKTEKIIDILFEPLKGQIKKPRTYPQKARRLFLSYSKKRQRSAKETRKAMGKQLGFLKRNLAIIDRLIERSSLARLSARQYKDLLVIRELYRQQQWMFDHRCHRIHDRIVSISQPHVRPIVRGKASAPTEFGAKLSASLVNGMVFLDHLDWNNFNESGDLSRQIEAYQQRFGCYPESVHCDAIYRTRENRNFCKEHGIRMSGPPLGRPPKETEDNAEELKAGKRQQYQDERDRIPIEGKFGQGKRRFSLDRIMAKLALTSESAIAISFIVMNLEKWLRKLFLFLFSRFQWPEAVRLEALYAFTKTLNRQRPIGHQLVPCCQRTAELQNCC